MKRWLDYLEKPSGVSNVSQLTLLVVGLNVIAQDSAWLQWPMRVVMVAFALSCLALAVRVLRRRRGKP